MKLFKNGHLTTMVLLLSAFSVVSCGGGTGTGNPELTEDTSASGAAAGAAGNALSNSGSSGTLAMIDFKAPGAKETFWAKTRSTLDFLPEALAANFCPTYASASGGGCTASSHTMWLSYSDCNFENSESSWHGTQALIMSAGSASCGTFPNPGSSQTLSRQFVAGAGSTTPLIATVKSPYGTVGVIDNTSTNLSNFNNDTITPFLNGGYGSQVAFNSAGARDSLRLSYRMSSALLFDQTINGTLAVADSGSYRTISGSVTVYHNGLQVIGTSTFSNVIHKDGCCFPTSGTITTQFTQGSVAPTAAGSLAVGKSEVLTLTGCGTGTLQSYDGTTTDVALTRCY
jgi:hypothetical protein